MGAVSVFTDRNLSLPTSEQLLVDKIVLEPFLLAWMESEPLFLAQDGVGAVASCQDGIYSSCFLLGWRSEQLLLAWWMVCICGVLLCQLQSALLVPWWYHLTSNIDWSFISQFGYRWSSSCRLNEDICWFFLKKRIALIFASCGIPQGLVLWVVAAS